MKTIELQTNIMCGACLAKVTQPLNEVVGESNWKVDLQNPKKILTVTAGSASESDIISALEKTGYKAKPVES
jgi:copper chaperone CopZ